MKMNRSLCKRLLAISMALALLAATGCGKSTPVTPPASSSSATTHATDTSLPMNFVRMLVDKTAAKELSWSALSADTAIDGQPASDVLGQCEFHEIDYAGSYLLQQEAATVMLVSERNLSGRDSRFDSAGHGLYVKPNADTPATCIQFNTDDVNRLKAAILGEEVPAPATFSELALQDVTADSVNELIRLTAAGALLWTSLDGDTVFSEDSDEMACDILGECEFHLISYFDSFFCPLPGGNLLLVDERNESGNDPAQSTEGFNLYILQDDGGSIESLVFDADSLYQLLNVVQLQQLPDTAVMDFLETATQK